MLFWAGLAARRSGLGLRSNVSVGIEAADCAVAFAEDAAAFLDQRLDLVDEFFFVKLFFGSAVGLFDMLTRELY